MDINHALTLPGWMNEASLTWLAGEAASHTRIVEIGSAAGRSTRALCDNTQGLVFSVDTWAGSPELKAAYADAGGGDGVFAWFTNNLADHLASGRLTILRGASAAVASHFVWPTFDMVFIDAAHDFQNVAADISLWSQTLREGGLICGHDYGDFSGVTRAVDLIIPNRHPADGTSIWYSHVSRSME